MKLQAITPMIKALWTVELAILTCCVSFARADVSEKASTGIYTFYALDPCDQTFSFSKNLAGEVIEENAVLLDGAEIEFSVHSQNTFSVGITNHTVGSIVDLGTSEELQRRYKYKEAVGHGQGFASIRRNGQKILVGTAFKDDDTATSREIEEASTLNSNLKSLASAPVILGHIYLLRVCGTSTGSVDMFVKVLVVAYQPDQFATIRWEIMK